MLRGCSLPPFKNSSVVSSPKPLVVLRGAKYDFATRSKTVVELVPPEKAITRDPTALSAFRLGPSGLGLIEGSRDLRNRV